MTLRGKVIAGLALVVLSFVLWFGLPAVPFLPIEGQERAALGGGLFVGAEITFWLGVALAGPEALRRLRTRFFGPRP